MSDTDTLARRAIAFLFVEGGTLSRTKLAHLVGCAAGELAPVLAQAAEKLAATGLTLVETPTHVALATAPDTAPAVRDVLMKELSRDIGDAGLEVLSIVLYRGPSSRAQIDYIRGVNTSSTIRTLLSRGLIERAGNPEDGREHLYRATPELLAHLGVTKVEDLPEYGIMRRDLASFEESQGSFVTHHGTTTTGTGDTADADPSA
ncbi:SMC-Scp complex subunit ScpB [Candidatus Kaiserbacteria bacterium]|nr:SMC-Scp complex subunit ScpB [Candidatus Kaiserbacteria bacterium]